MREKGWSSKAFRSRLAVTLGLALLLLQTGCQVAVQVQTGQTPSSSAGGAGGAGGGSGSGGTAATDGGITGVAVTALPDGTFEGESVVCDTNDECEGDVLEGA